MVECRECGKTVPEGRFCCNCGKAMVSEERWYEKMIARERRDFVRKRKDDFTGSYFIAKCVWDAASVAVTPRDARFVTEVSKKYRYERLPEIVELAGALYEMCRDAERKTEGDDAP